MSVFLSTFGIVGFIVFLTVLAVSIFQKKSKKINITSALGMLVCLIVFTVGFSIAPNSIAPGNEDAVASGTPSPTVASESPTPSVQTPSATPKATAVSPNPSQYKIVPGLTAADIEQTLEKLNLKKANSTTLKDENGSDYLAYTSETKDPGTGVTLSYRIKADASKKVKYAVFFLMNTSSIPEKDFIEVATKYLKQFATLPFNGAESDKSSKWVEENIASCNAESAIKELTIGEAKFSLYGMGDDSRFLEINAAQ